MIRVYMQSTKVLLMKMTSYFTIFIYLGSLFRCLSACSKILLNLTHLEVLFSINIENNTSRWVNSRTVICLTVPQSDFRLSWNFAITWNLDENVILSWHGVDLNCRIYSTLRLDYDRIEIQLRIDLQLSFC